MIFDWLGRGTGDYVPWQLFGTIHLNIMIFLLYEVLSQFGQFLDHRRQEAESVLHVQRERGSLVKSFVYPVTLELIV